MSTWQIDESHSAISFSAKHMMVSTVRGRFGRFHGTIEYDPERPADASVEVAIDIASISTGWQQRDDHLRSPDFLDAAGFPELTFRSTRVEMTAEDEARIHGDLTIRGVSKPVVLAAQRVAVVTGMQGERRAAFEARTKVDREAWGLTWNVGLEAGGWLVGREITIDLDIAAVEQSASRSASQAA
jgi:polyisoprenoid-binding protein YceI